LPAKSRLHFNLKKKMKFNFTKNLTHAGGLAVGALGVKLTDKVFSNLNPDVRGLAQIGLGLAGPILLKSKPGSFVESVGDGMVAVGAYKMLEKIPALAGINDMSESIGEAGYVIDQGTELSGVDDLDESIAGLGQDELDA
jgi:hypothetical protein